MKLNLMEAVLRGLWSALMSLIFIMIIGFLVFMPMAAPLFAIFYSMFMGWMFPVLVVFTLCIFWLVLAHTASKLLKSDDKSAQLYKIYLYVMAIVMACICSTGFWHYYFVN